MLIPLEADIRRNQRTLHLRAPHNIRRYCWPLLIWDVFRLASETEEVALGGVGGEVKEGLEHDFFRGRQYVVHEVLASVKSFR